MTVGYAERVGNCSTPVDSMHLPSNDLEALERWFFHLLRHCIGHTVVSAFSFLDQQPFDLT
jgi:hypothetical protein